MLRRTAQLVSRRALASISFENFGAANVVLKKNSQGSNAVPSVGEVKVVVKSSEIFVDDIALVNGTSFHSTVPGIAGTTAVGTVSAVGANVSQNVNDKVFVVSNGTWSDTIVVKSNAAFSFNGITHEEASSFGSFVSATLILKNYAKLNAGDLVLVCNGESGLNAAIHQVGNALGLNVKTVTEAEINDAKFIETIRAAGRVKLAVAGRSGKYIRQVFKVLPRGGSVVLYSGVLNSKAEGIDIPMGAAIFNNISVGGFDLRTAAKTDATGFQAAVNETASLIGSKKIKVASKAFAWGEFSGAIDATKTSGVPSQLQF